MFDCTTMSMVGKRLLVPALAVLTASGAIARAAEAADGELDRRFGNDGRVVTGFSNPSNDGANDIAIQADGRIVAVGVTSPPRGAGDFGIARYNANGTLDTTFGNGGLVITDFSKGIASDEVANAVAIQRDGKIVVAGTRREFNFVTTVAIARYDTNGAPDPTFGAGGRIVIPFGTLRSAANDVAIADDGKIVVVGNADNAWAIARFNADGSPDASFEGDGLVLTSFGNNFAEANAVSVLDDGRIVAAGTSAPDIDSVFALARYNTDGSLDQGFGTGGVVETDVAPDGSDAAHGLAIQADGKIVVAGGAGNDAGTSSSFGVVRYEADGSLDAGFGTAGITIVTATTFSEGRDIALQADERIVVAGSIFPGLASADVAVLRLDQHGVRDETFGSRGLAVAGFASVNPSGFHVGRAVAVQRDGKIVAAGNVNGDFGLARFEATSPLGMTPR
jgi:uncharacterized delta-60 repeat protein